MEKYLVPKAIREGDLSDQWLLFKREFAQFLVAVDKGKATEEVKLAVFLRTVGPRVNDLVEMMQFAEGEDGSKFQVVSKKLDDLCAIASTLRETNSSSSSRVARVGVDNERIRRRLFETENLDLPKAKRICQNMEATASDLQSLVANKAEVSEGNAQPTVSDVGSVKAPTTLQKCARREVGVHLVEKESSPPESEEEVLLISVDKVGKKLLAQVPFRVNGRTQTIVCQLDTAASCNVLARSDYRKLGNLPVQESGTTLTMYDGSVRKSLGRCQVQVHNRQEEVTWLEFEILETKHHTSIITGYMLGPAIIVL
eukprot:Em0011g462a